jgi:hypothetical protein
LVSDGFTNYKMVQRKKITNKTSAITPSIPGRKLENQPDPRELSPPHLANELLHQARDVGTRDAPLGSAPLFGAQQHELEIVRIGM